MQFITKYAKCIYIALALINISYCIYIRNFYTDVEVNISIFWLGIIQGIPISLLSLSSVYSEMAIGFFDSITGPKFATVAFTVFNIGLGYIQWFIITPFLVKSIRELKKSWNAGQER